MRKVLFSLTAVLMSVFLSGQELAPVELPAPDKTKGLPVMQALGERASVREWLPQKLGLQVLSDILWAANGINRPDEGKRTAASAMNAQDIDVYAFTDTGIFLYNALNHRLEPVAAGDYRDLPGMTDAPLNLVLVSDISRFRTGSDSVRMVWACMDSGIVSQNIAIYCAGTGLKTRPRVGFPGAAKMRELMRLKDSQHLMLNHPVGYPR
ncbi:MAG: SagB/ThcOx family dehydrogenase [Bacteroidales bacterium]|jgi:nitroreductase|nr:SagB/ThcOx family dehydrogenase [Bacteroidales bacterium]